LKIEEVRAEYAMATQFSWDSAEDLGLMLADEFPGQNPLEVRFTDLHKMVTDLPGFADDPQKSTEGKLEAIQMAWYEEWQDRNE
jgi:FeS assembly protein IscX